MNIVLEGQETHKGPNGSSISTRENISFFLNESNTKHSRQNQKLLNNESRNVNYALNMLFNFFTWNKEKIVVSSYCVSVLHPYMVFYSTLQIFSLVLRQVLGFFLPVSRHWIVHYNLFIFTDTNKF